MRQHMVVANWKMNGSRDAVGHLLRGLNSSMQLPRCDVILAPGYLHIDQVSRELSLTGVSLAGQNCSEYSDGPYTGEVSAKMLADSGCKWVILGHSERRQYHGETNEVIASKIELACSENLGVIYCVGETITQRDSGDAQSVVREQLLTALNRSINEESRIVIAYEPVWAIGTGLTASPNEAQIMHSYIRENLRSIEAINAEDTVILYGGSVNAVNANDFFSQVDIDGVLVGGASLDAEAFCRIVDMATLKREN